MKDHIIRFGSEISSLSGEYLSATLIDYSKNESVLFKHDNPTIKLPESFFTSLIELFLDKSNKTLYSKTLKEMIDSKLRFQSFVLNDLDSISLNVFILRDFKSFIVLTASRTTNLNEISFLKLLEDMQ